MSEINEVTTDDSHLNRVANLAVAYVSGNRLQSQDLPELIHSISSAFNRLKAPVQVEIVPSRPAVSINKSITADYIICLDDGKSFKSLKRHIATLGMTPDQYRAKWGLPKDYPMVAPNYTEARSRLAKAAGLGQKRAAKDETESVSGVADNSATIEDEKVEKVEATVAETPAPKAPTTSRSRPRAKAKPAVEAANTEAAAEAVKETVEA